MDRVAIPLISMLGIPERLVSGIFRWSSTAALKRTWVGLQAVCNITLELRAWSKVLDIQLQTLPLPRTSAPLIYRTRITKHVCDEKLPIAISVGHLGIPSLPQILSVWVFVQQMQQIVIQLRAMTVLQTTLLWVNYNEKSKKFTTILFKLKENLLNYHHTVIFCMY